MDPLSMSIAVLSITKVCITVAWQLKLFVEGAKLSNTAINVLLQEVESFEDILKKLDMLLKDPQTNGSVGLTGHWGSHWTHVNTLLDDARVMICGLKTKVTDISRTVKLLDSARKQARLLNAADELEVYQQQIKSYRETIQMSLQTASLWYQTSNYKSSQDVVVRLDKLQADIRRLGGLMKRRIQTIEAHSKRASPSDAAAQDDLAAQLTATQNLAEYLRSAASIVSSASTALQDRAEMQSSVGGSNYGDIFAPSSDEIVRDWIEGNTISEQTDISGLSIVDDMDKATIDAPKQNETWDSDDEHEIELASALHQQARSEMDGKDYEKAERSIRMSLSMLPELQTISVTNSTMLQLGMMADLVEALRAQCKWQDAQAVLREKMAILSQQNNAASNEDPLDAFALAKILHAQGEYTEALLYGRMSYKALTKLGDSHQHERKGCLALLAAICRDNGDSSMAAAYTAMADKNLSLVETSIATPEESKRTWTLAGTLKGESINAIAYSPDGRTLAVFSRYQVKFLDVKTCIALLTLNIWEIRVRSLAISPDSQTLAISSYEDILLFNVQTGMDLAAANNSNLPSKTWPRCTKLRGHTALTTAAVFSPDGSLVASSSIDKTLKIWNSKTGEMLRTLQGHTQTINAVLFSPDGKILASASDDKTARLWDVQSGKEIRKMSNPSKVLAIAFTPDAETLVAASGKTIQLWNTETGTTRNVIYGHSGDVLAVAVLRDGKTLVAGCSGSRKLWLWNYHTAEILQKLACHRSSVKHIAVSPDGNTIATVSSHYLFDNTMRLWSRNG